MHGSIIKTCTYKYIDNKICNFACQSPDMSLHICIRHGYCLKRLAPIQGVDVRTAAPSNCMARCCRLDLVGILQCELDRGRRPPLLGVRRNDSARSITGEEKLTANDIYRHIGALGAAALILGASAAHSQNFIYGNSAGNGMYQIDANTGVVAKACSQSKGNGRGIVVVSSVVYFTVANSGNVYKTNFATC